MSQSFVNTDSFPIAWDLQGPQIEKWVWPKLAFRVYWAQKCIHFLRCPESGQGVVYRIARVGVIFLFQVRLITLKDTFFSAEN